MNQKKQQATFTRGIVVVGGIVLFSIPFLVMLYNAFAPSDVNTEIAAVFLGTIVSAIVTVLLLRGQTDIEENKEISLHIFEKKQEVYFDYIETLERITQDGRINVPGTPSYMEPEEGGYNDELQHLVYQLGKLQMTAGFETAQDVTSLTGRILSALEDKSKDKRSQYSDFADKVFELVSLLRDDLYHGKDKKSQQVSSDKFRDTLNFIDFGSGKGKEFSQETLILSQFCDLLKGKIAQKYSLRSYFIASTDAGGKLRHEVDINSRLAAEIFLDMKAKNTGLALCIQVRNEFVWIELVTGKIQAGFRIRKNDNWEGSGWSRRMFSVKKEDQLDFRTNPKTLQEFGTSDAASQEAFVEDFLQRFDGLDKTLRT